MAKVTDEYGNDIDVGICELTIGVVCLAAYMFVWALWFTPFLLMVGLCWLLGVAYVLACGLARWIEAVYYNFKDSGRD